MALVVNLPTAVPAVSGIVNATGGRLRRLSARETSGTVAAVFDIYDGYGVGGILLDTISLTAGQSTRDRYEHEEYVFDNGLYLNVVSGTFKASFTVHLSDHWEREGMPVVLVNPDVLSVTVGPS